MGLYTVAVDLGASNGRIMLGNYDGNGVSLLEIHRFLNEPVMMNGVLYWDIFRLFHEIKEGLKKIAALGIEIASLGADTWGVDYCLLDADGSLTGLPVNYRDTRTDGVIETVSGIIPPEDLYGRTGIQFMKINTIFQLYADSVIRPDVLNRANTFLMMPDMINFLLSGAKYNEYTILSTTQLLNAGTKEIDPFITGKLSIPDRMFCETVKPGHIIGRFTESICEETGLSGVDVVAVGCHDTASAVAGTPLSDDRTAFLSCGTWSLLGVELKAPVISKDSYACNFTNEGGVMDTVRFLKNINGLWIIQQLRKHYNENHGLSVGFADIAAAAENAHKKGFAIDPSDPAFTAPADMERAIRGYLKEHGQGEPDGLGELAASVYNGLTEEYRTHVENLEMLTDRRIDTIHMIGGGIQDEFLCELTAKKTGRRVVAGPVEASVLGNIIMQLAALGEIDGLEQGRELISNSFEEKTYA